jgi:REP element-mobilizing transposase RayT
MTIWACAILPEHVHLVVKDHRYSIVMAANLLKGAATRHLKRAGLHPFQDSPRDDGSLPPCRARNLWKVFIHDEEHLQSAIRYVEDNPLKEGKRRQKWSFVIPYPQTYDDIHGDDNNNNDHNNDNDNNDRG